jgi:hypothetical protein
VTQLYRFAYARDVLTRYLQSQDLELVAVQLQGAKLRKGCRHSRVRRTGPVLFITKCFAVLELNDDELGGVLEVLCRVHVAVAASQ